MSMEDLKALTECAECTWDYIDRLRMALASACKERDAAVADLEAAGICDFCGNWVHRDGKVLCGKKGKCEFVWRGPQKEADT